jgi:RNA polymerase sigma-70 factor (ECF subfamily)
MLSQEEATALWLHYGEDLPARDIATILGRSYVSVKVMIFRSRKKLASVLEELAPEGVGFNREAMSAREKHAVPDKHGGE